MEPFSESIITKVQKGTESSSSDFILQRLLWLPSRLQEGGQKGHVLLSCTFRISRAGAGEVVQQLGSCTDFVSTQVQFRVRWRMMTCNSGSGSFWQTWPAWAVAYNMCTYTYTCLKIILKGLQNFVFYFLCTWAKFYVFNKIKIHKSHKKTGKKICFSF